MAGSRRPVDASPTIWNETPTYGKAGTTWTRQIVGQLVFDGDPEVNVAELSPWLDLRVPPKDVELPLAALHFRLDEGPCRQRRAVDELGAECAHWLATGER